MCWWRLLLLAARLHVASWLQGDLRIQSRSARTVSAVPDVTQAWGAVCLGIQVLQAGCAGTLPKMRV